VLHEPFRANWADYAISSRALTEARREPAGEPHIRYAGRVIGVVVSEKLHIDPAERNLKLREPDSGAPAGVDQEFPVARLDQRAGAEAFDARDRRAGPKQSDAEVGRHELILIPASLTTFAQNTVSART